jgi:uncharacterized protein
LWRALLSAIVQVKAIWALLHMPNLNRRLIPHFLLAALAAVPAWAAADIGNPYQVTMVTSGTSVERRSPALAQLFGDVLVKVSGNRQLATDPRVQRSAADAASTVDSFTYYDRMTGIALHDEQGSYDRPNDFTVTFDKAKIDTVLSSLGEKPWPEPRPHVLLFVGTRKGDTVFSPASDGDHDPGMRATLAASAIRYGVHAAFAASATLAAAGASFTTLPDADLAALDTTAKKEGADAAVAGTLDFSDTVHGWIVNWRMQWQGQTYRWGISGVSYDDAYRDAVAGAASILSGHGALE